MFEFPSLRSKEMSMAKLTGELAVDYVRNLTNEMADRMIEFISDCVALGVQINLAIIQTVAQSAK